MDVKREKSSVAQRSKDTAKRYIVSVTVVL